MGLVWMVGRSEGTFGYFFPKLKISLTLLFILYKVFKREIGDKNLCTFLLLFLFLHLLTIFIFFQVLLCWKSAAPIFLLLLRFVSWVFTFVLHGLWDDCWWDSFKSWEMFYSHEFMFVWYGISRIWGYLLGNVKE